MDFIPLPSQQIISKIDILRDAAMITGGSPTNSFLNLGTQARHTGFVFDWMAPSVPDSISFADVGFMVALLLLGVALMLGVGCYCMAI